MLTNTPPSCVIANKLAAHCHSPANADLSCRWSKASSKLHIHSRFPFISFTSPAPSLGLQPGEACNVQPLKGQTWILSCSPTPSFGLHGCHTSCFAMLTHGNNSGANRLCSIWRSSLAAFLFANPNSTRTQLRFSALC
jgi:hypothetical protein